MNTPASIRRHWSAIVAVTIGWFSSALALSAQTAGAGAIQGRVYNPVQKQYVNNAEVRLAGTNQIVYTAQDGSFQFDRVPAGSVEVTVSYSGYNTASDKFTVTAGQTVNREIDLTAAGEAADKGVV